MKGRTIKLSIGTQHTYSDAKGLLDLVGLKENPHIAVKDISVGKQQLVEIAKTLSKKVKLLILDEPTASLNEDDSEHLLNLLLDLKKQGLTSILISHLVFRSASPRLRHQF
jgi:ABC-type sugar transport system, ATPase component